MNVKTAFYLIITICTLLGFSNGTMEKSKPNIILIMSDDLGWLDVGFNGNTEVKTPHLDQLAKSGIIFDRFYAASAVCSPTRASVITGRNPLRMNIPTANSGHMKDAEITLPELLQKQDYATGHFGKWHLGTLTKTVLDANRGGKEKFISDFSIPTDHGYDQSFCTESKVPTFDPMLAPISFDLGESLRYGWRAIIDSNNTKPYGTAYWNKEGQKVNNNLTGENSRIIMDRVLPFIKNAKNSNKPFFSTIWLHTPHLPVVSDTIHRGMYADLGLQKQLYYGSITAMDEQIGRLWKALEELDIQDETILFFCSDNGPERGTPGSAGVFRERKRSLYEGGLRTPAFMIWQNRISGGKRINFPAVTSDYLPTILEILDIEYPDDRPIDGESLWSVIQGQNNERENGIGFLFNSKISWVDNQYKYISNDNGLTFELYDLLADKAEKTNIIAEKPEIATKMELKLMTWISSVEASKMELDY